MPNIKIYPNPANDVLFVNGLVTDTKIELLDMVGRKVYSGVSNNERENINISNLSTGNYIIQLTSNDGQRMTGKVVKR
ncbi:T9SS type A sorting domain-containing protein [Algoriphagus sp. D3-2-R+10]|uniref:T9SS type A sorting domain-containing protein n=1 Tax=Algoriphagus aurantiacus TaxID=3103948 RepID=UPI002B3C6138|nr:T9SS type A sorting domain-containing protein [Algoriphagus sp. D3-2-R+10]MEB2778122.1 T9SS type A sorting domain-containing protein [Algoriphagus sp. D3-2-R+10]